MEVLDDDQLN